VNNGRRFQSGRGRGRQNEHGSERIQNAPIRHRILLRLTFLMEIRSATMAAKPVYYATSGFWVLVIGIILIVVSSFGVTIPVINMFEFGVGACFASFLVR